MPDTDDPLGGKSESNSDTEDKKVTPVSGNTELIELVYQISQKRLGLAFPYLLMRGVY